MGERLTAEDFIGGANRHAEENAKPRPKIPASEFIKPVPQIDYGGPGVAASFARGVAVEAPSTVAGLVGEAADALTYLVPGGQHLPEMGEPMAQGARDLASRFVDVADPITQRERTAMAAGEGLGMGLAAAPIAAVAGPAAVAAELGFSTLGSAAGEEMRARAEKAEMGPLAEGAASIGADALLAMAAPAVGVPAVAKTPAKLKALRQAWEASPEVDALAARLGVSPRALLRESSEFKRHFPEDPRGNEAFITESSEALGEAIDKYDPQTIPTTRQILNNNAGSDLARLEKEFGRNSDFGMKVEGRRQASLRDLSERYEGLRPEEGAAEASRAFEVIRDQRNAAIRLMWKGIPKEDIPPIPTAGIKAGAQEAAERAGEFASDIPEEVAKVLEWPEFVDFDRYHNMRSRMLQSQRIGSRGSADTLAQRRAGHLSPLIDSMNAQLDEMAGAGGEAYKRALASTRKFYDDFDPRSAAVRGLEDYTEGARMVSKIKSAKDPAAEAARARRIVEQEPGGLEGLQRIFMDDLVGITELDGVSFKRAQDRLRKNENAMRVVMGDEGFESAMDILDRARISSVGGTGHASEAVRTGSGLNGLEVLLAKGADFVEPSGFAASIVAKMARRTVNKDGTHVRIMREALLDPSVAKILLDTPADRAVEAWAVEWMKMVNRVEAGRIVSKNVGGEE